MKNDHLFKMSVQNSPNIKFIIDCDEFGHFSAQPVSSGGESNASTLVPIVNKIQTFPTSYLTQQPRRDSTESFNSDWVYDHEDLEMGRHSDTDSFTWRTANSSENCRCEHQHAGIPSNVVDSRTCSDSSLLGVMIALTAAFSICEFGFGFANVSLALVADAFHMMSDAAALIIAIVAIQLGKRPEADSDAHTFGWKRAEVIGALINGVYLASVCLFIILESIIRLFKPEKLENPWQVFWVGIVGFIINIIGLGLFFSHRSLAQHGHAGHSHSHHDNDNIKDSEARSGTSSVNMHGVFLHVLGDAIGSVIVVGTALATIYVPFDWSVYFDPCCSILFALLILKSSIPLIKQCSTILMQSAPRSISIVNLKKDLLSVQDVSDVHELHVWQMVPNYNVATVHIISSSFNRVALVKKCNEIFCKAGIHRTTIQLE